MSVALTQNFLANARGLEFLDGGGATWTFNPNTNSLSVAVSGTGIVPGSVVNTDLANMAASTIKGNATGSPASPQDLSVSTAKTLLSLNLVENTALSTWAGSTNIASLGTISTGVWQGTAIANSFIASALTGKTYNGLTLTAQVVGFTIAGGATPETLTVGANASVSGTNTGDQALPTAANPTAKVGVTAVNGIAVTFMRSDAAPPIDLTQSYTWTGSHTFKSNPVASDGFGTNYTLAGSGFTAATYSIGINTGSSNMTISRTDVAIDILDLTTGGNVIVNRALGWNGATPPAQITGFGTPVGAAVVASYNSGSSTTLQDKQTIAQILAIMKAHGMIGV